MKTLGKSVLFSVLLTLGITAYLNMDSLKSSKADVRAIEVAAGAVSLSDPTSPDPLVHCYPVPNSDALDIRTRMDFEARTSGGWVPASDRAGEGEFCLIETAAAVEKRLAEHAKP